jgi:hypothetical protein
MESTMTFIPSKLGLAAGLTFALWQPVALAQSAAASLFDDRVAAGLPQAFSLVRQAEDEHGGGVDQVVVEEKLDTDVLYPDGSHATTYVGTANGLEATFSRIGEELSVSVFADRPGTSMPAQRVRRATQAEPDDVIAAPVVPTVAGSQGVTVTAAPRELRFWIFLHDRAGETNYAKFHSWYIAWWARDMERTVKPGVPVKVFIVAGLPGVTDFDYHQGSASQALLGFRNVADRYLHDAGVQPSGLTKTMLFVDERPANWNGAYGMALQRDTVAMASRTGPRHGIAHEFGHTLDATHEFGETRFPCVTNMQPYTVGMYSCRVYTKRNDTQIREHVKEELARHADD